jgi:hypothetical protein
MRLTKSCAATLLASLLFLAETAAAQAGASRSDPPAGNSEVEVVITVWAPADAPADELYRAILKSISQLPLDGTAAASVGEVGSKRADNRRSSL